jgi:DNA-binding GntR family transcriptional regulator
VIEPLRRGRLTTHAYNVLRDGILRGEFQVGAVLAETQIAERLQISRTPVRQALGLLLQEGLVEVGPRRQLIVRGFTPDHQEEIQTLREALESVAVRRACEVMEVEDIDEMRLLLMRQRRAAAEGREDDFIRLDEEFHLKIAEAARLPILYTFLGQLRGFVRVVRLGSTRHPSHMVQVVAEHECIVDALDERDADDALNALSEHLHTRDYVLAETVVGQERAL